MSFEFELVTVRAEISHAHAVARRRTRIVHYELRVMIKSGTKRLRGECQEKQKAHLTTDNADVTEEEAKAMSDTKEIQMPKSRRLQSFLLILFA